MALLQYGEGKEELDILMRFMKNRIAKQKTVTIAVTGGLGTGKSYTCLRISEIWYKYYFKEEFPIKNCCFGIIEAMKLLTSGGLRKGEIIILEEAGISINAKKFFSDVNKLFNYYMQAFRQKQVMILFNCPVFDFLDKSTRILINANFITQKIDRDKKLCIVKPLFHQLNQQMGKIYNHYLRTYASKKGYGFTVKINRMEFNLPSKRLIKEYEYKKDEFVTELGKRNLEELERKEKVKFEIKYPHNCVECNYKWESLKEEPARCPKCDSKSWKIAQISKEIEVSTHMA